MFLTIRKANPLTSKLEDGRCQHQRRIQRSGSGIAHYIRKNKSGHIINISLSAAHHYFPGGALYCATKGSRKMFTEGLRH